MDTDVPGPPHGRRRHLTAASAGLGERIEAMRAAEELQTSQSALRGLLTLACDVVLLLRDLSKDPQVPGHVTTRPLLVAVAYALSPVQVIPNHVRIVGRADELLVLAWAFRRILRDAGYARIYAHWRGSDEGLAVVMALAGVQE